MSSIKPEQSDALNDYERILDQIREPSELATSMLTAALITLALSEERSRDDRYEILSGERSLEVRLHHDD